VFLSIELFAGGSDLLVGLAGLGLVALPFVLGMAGADTQTIDGLLKDYVEPKIAEAVYNRNPLKDLFKFTSKGFTGREVILSAHTGGTASPMFVAEDGAFADAGAQEHAQLRVGQKKLMARIRMTYEAMQDSMSSEGAFRSARKSEMEGIIDDIAHREEFALATDGRGVLALVDEASPTGDTTLELDAPGNWTGDDFGNRFVQKGMKVAAINPATGALRASSAKTVTAVNSDGTDVTLSAAMSNTADNDYLVQAANESVTSVLDTSYEQAFWGIPALIDDGTIRSNYFGIDRTVHDGYKSYVKSSTGALSEDVLQQISDIADQRMGGRIDYLFGHHSVRRLFIQLTTADRRYLGASLMKPDPGTAAFKQGDLTMGEVEFKAIRTAPLGALFFIDKSAGFVCYESEKGKWVDEDGSVLIRVGGSGSAGRDAYEAWYRVRRQYFCELPGKCAVATGITGQTLVVVRGAGRG
jgi:hypothetical protein